MKIYRLKIFYIIIAGELIFSLPFHISRFFRPSLLEDFNYSNSMIGAAFSLYGITALICYFPGGYIADRFDARKLLSLSLVMTSFGGIVLLNKPNYFIFCMLYCFWGITTILFFWSALIKATRLIGREKQGFSFGMLEAGRGFVASICASLAALIYSEQYIKNYFNEVLNKDISSLNLVIVFYTFLTFLSSLIIWFFYKTDKETKLNTEKINYKELFNLYKPIMLISIVVFSAYTGYKSLDYYSQYFYEIMKYSKEKTAFLMSNLSYLRPFCAIVAGIIADKITSKRITIFLFIISSISFIILSTVSNITVFYIIIISNITLSMIAVFSLRGIYFSLLKENVIPVKFTGISVGIISLVGFFPDIYVGPLFGYYLDNLDIFNAFKNCFYFLFIVSLAGIVSSLYLKENKLK